MNQAPKTGKHPRGLMVFSLLKCGNDLVLTDGRHFIALFNKRYREGYARAMGADIVGTFIAWFI
jgi:hypothetical protein